MILDVPVTAHDFVHYLRGYLEDKTCLSEVELSSLKEKLNGVCSYSVAPFPPYHYLNPFIPSTDKPDLSRGPTCTGDSRDIK